MQKEGFGVGNKSTHITAVWHLTRQDALVEAVPVWAFPAEVPFMPQSNHGRCCHKMAKMTQVPSQQFESHHVSFPLFSLQVVVFVDVVGRVVPRRARRHQKLLPFVHEP